MECTADLDLAGPAIQGVFALAEAAVVEAMTAVQAFEVGEGLQWDLDGLALHVGSFDGWNHSKGLFACAAGLLLNMSGPIVL